VTCIVGREVAARPAERRARRAWGWSGRAGL